MRAMLRPMLTSLRGWVPGPGYCPAQLVPARLLQAYPAAAGSHSPEHAAHGLPVVYHEAYSAPQLPPGHRFPMVRYRGPGKAQQQMPSFCKVQSDVVYTAPRGSSGGFLTCCWRTV